MTGKTLAFPRRIALEPQRRPFSTSLSHPRYDVGRQAQQKKAGG
jgi:hypothetical protein